jgi:hypothetical protein
MSFATRYRLAAQGLGDDAFAAWLAALATSTDPIELYLSGNQLTAVSIGALERAAPGAPMLLSLADNPIGDEGARILGARAWFASVGVLQLAGCGLGVAAVDALLGADSALSNVEDLDLARNGLDDEGVALLARAPRTATLTALALDEVGLGDRGAAALAASPLVRGLRSLSLGGNRLTAEGVAALRASVNLAECTLDFGTAE